MEPHQYTAAQLREAAKIGHATYAQWRARGYIRSERPSEGTGKQQLYSFEEVFVAAVGARLVRQGLPVGTAFAHCSRTMLLRHGVRTYLLLRPCPDLQVDGIEFGPDDDGIASDVMTESDLMAKIGSLEGGVFVCITDVFERVRASLQSSGRAD